MEGIAEELSQRDIASERTERIKLQQELYSLRKQYVALKEAPMLERSAGRVLDLSLIIKKGKEISLKLKQGQDYKSIKQYLSEDAELAEALVLQLIMDLYLFLNVSHSFSTEQFRPTAKMVLAKCKGLTIEDLTICFHKVKAAQYKSSYGRLDGQVILGWIDQYKKERREKLAQQQQNMHLGNRFYSDRLNERILNKFKKKA